MSQHDAPNITEDDEPSSELLGTVISGRYRLESLLGEGGMGAVYLAEHTHMRKRLALKVLHPEMTRRPEVVARFEREAMAAAHIEHPNVASATDFGKLDDGSFFLVLEYIEGRGLREELRQGALGISRSFHIVKQIASALARAHSLGIVHRDLKPENVMLVERDGDPDFVKVLDFGIAKVPVSELSGTTSEVLTRAGMVFGTPEYMAPEQALGKDVDHRADLYALGVILYELLTGSRPFEAESAVTLLGMQVTQAPPSMGPKVPKSIEAVVMRLLEKEASARYQSAREVIQAMDEALALEGLAMTPQGEMSRISSALPRPSVVERLGRQVATKLMAKIAELPRMALLGGAMALLVLGVVASTLLASTGSERNGAASAAPLLDRLLPSSKASEEELAAAIEKGADELEVLVAKYPKDVEARKALARAQAENGQHALALENLAQLFDQNAALIEDPELRTLLLDAARSQEAADAAFELLESKLGSAGPDLLFELATGRGSQRAASRATAALKRDEVRALASPELLVALDLRSAASCQAKKAVLPRVEELGDERSLLLLRPLLNTTGCGFVKRGDCWPCLRDGSLTRAIKAVEARK